MRKLIIPALLIGGVAVAVANLTAPVVAGPSPSTDALQAAIDMPHRSAANRARDAHRHPRQTLRFFGVRPTDNVVELWPGGGWYTEILAPYLAAQGKLTVAPPLGPREEPIKRLLASDPALYGKVALAHFPKAENGIDIPAGSADVVLTFRNVHNWRFAGADSAQEAFNQIYAMLKPGGVLGVVDHRLPEKMDSGLEQSSGYMKRSSVVGFAKAAGFRLAGESRINANPKDTHNWPDGVWTLPPVYRLGDKDREKYAAIGESDRMTLKFVKPRR